MIVGCRTDPGKTRAARRGSPGRAARVTMTAMSRTPEPPPPPAARGTELTAAIVLAAGRSARMGGVDKLWLEIAGAPLIARPLRMLGGMPELDVLVIVAPPERHAELRAFTANHPDVRCIAGGAQRQDSVDRGLDAVPEATWVLVHDGARPFASRELARRVLAGAQRYRAAIPGLPITDTVKRVNARGLVVDSVARAPLRTVQTPQGFAADLLRRAHDSADDSEATDDAMLVERLGHHVAMVEGEPGNIKVTTADDLPLMGAMLEAGLVDEPQAEPATRSDGTGSDGAAPR